MSAYSIVRKEKLGMVFYRVISWEGDTLIDHGSFGWLRDARAFVKSLEGRA